MSKSRTVFLQDGKEDYQLTIDEHMRLWALEYAVKRSKREPYIDTVNQAKEYYNFLKGKE